MEFECEFGGRKFRADLRDPIDISIPLDFHGPQPNAFGVERAVAVAVRSGGLVGDTRQGGSCNFEGVTLIPHCNGTHTECVGHITHERISVRDCLKDAFVPALLVSVEPVKVQGSDDLTISQEVLADKLNKSIAAIAPGSDSALIVRTLPNDSSKLTREYREVVPPYFSTEAMKFIVASGVKHLLVDLPSVDRLYDEGKLANHRLFWNVEPGKFETISATRTGATITELIYVPDEVADGEYLLNLQIAPFAGDAAPSRPVLFRIKDS